MALQVASGSRSGLHRRGFPWKRHLIRRLMGTAMVSFGNSSRTISSHFNPYTWLLLISTSCFLGTCLGFFDPWQIYGPGFLRSFLRRLSFNRDLPLNTVHVFLANYRWVETKAPPQHLLDSTPRAESEFLHHSGSRAFQRKLCQGSFLERLPWCSVLFI